MRKPFFRSRIFLAVLIATAVIFVSCEKETIEPANPTHQGLRKAVTASMLENFESGTKTAYAAASVTLSTGSWYLDDALIGTTTSDRKNGLKSVRVVNVGKVTMLFNYANGASTVDIYHAKYGTDGTSTWDLYMSVNSGTSWTKVGSTVTTSSTTLTKASFTVNQIGNVRFEIRKISGGSARINIDDFTIYAYSSGTVEIPTRDNNMALGNPSGAVASTSYPTNYLMTKTQYTLSYNDTKKTCNWVSWHLSTAWLGTTPRQDNFASDYTLPSTWVKVSTTDYTNSGFDRGHMCPSADRTGSVEDNTATFLMTNMIPQAPINNQQTWAYLENYCRTLIDAGNELYIISGPYGQGGTGSLGYKTTISTKNIVVPSYVWKIIVVLPVGSSDITRITSSTRIIAVWMPNTQTVNAQPWGYYRKSVDYIESQTGYNFLSLVSTTIQAIIEASVDTGPTS